MEPKPYSKYKQELLLKNKNKKMTKNKLIKLDNSDAKRGVREQSKS